MSNGIVLPRHRKLMDAAKASPTLDWHAVPSHIAEGPPEVRHADGWLVCETCSDGYARLIVQAPAMLRELEKLDGHLGILMGNIHGSAKVDHRWEGMETVVRGWRDDIKAVTSKALGRS